MMNALNWNKDSLLYAKNVIHWIIGRRVKQLKILKALIPKPRIKIYSYLFTKVHKLGLEWWYRV